MRKEIKVMEVLRVPPMGKLVVEVNQERYQDLSQITDDQIKRLLLAAIGELVGFAGGYETLVAAGMAPALMPNQATETTAPELPVSISQAQQQAEFLASLEAETDALRSTSPLREPSVLRPQRTAPLPEPSPSKSSEVGIVEQIDAILQKYLAIDASLAQRSIHLEQDPSGGLRIGVDGTYYQKPAQIRDPKIQKCIKRALKEWEAS